MTKRDQRKTQILLIELLENFEGYMNEINSNQLNFDFSLPQEPNSSSEVQIISLSDAEMFFYQSFYEIRESDKIFNELLEKIDWQQDTIKYYGKEMPLPRLTAWYGDKGTNYKYSGIGNEPLAWTKELLEIKKKIENICNFQFNSVLLNLYRNGKDAVSWHQDNEKELGKNPTIASLSFGATRKFQFRHKIRKDVGKFEIALVHGSLLIMKGTTQEFWQHQIPKTSKLVGQRINLTFRYIY